MGINTAVLGIGNLLLRDEGVGVHAARALRKRYVFPEGVEIIDGGTMGLDLLPFVEGRDSLLIIDAVDFGAGPGAIKVIEGEDIKTFLDMKFSVHQIGLPDMLFAASLAGMAPPRICLVGIQPHIIDTGLELSDALKERFGVLMDAVVEKLTSWGLEVKETTDVPCDSVQDS
jgi:hydrogenase maturation protease